MKKQKTIGGLFLAFAMALALPPFGVSDDSDKPIMNLKDSKVRQGITSRIEKLIAKTIKNSYYTKKLWPTMNSLRTLGNNIYLIDYQYDYDIDDLMNKGVSSATELLSYASKHILHNAHQFKMGKWGLGCSVYEAKNEAGDNIMGRNFDYMDAPCYVVWTHPDDAYASISMVDGTFMLTTNHLSPTSVMGRMQMLLAPYLCLDGINEKGLAVAVLQIHADGTNQDTGKTNMFTTTLIRCCLDKCATVDEAIAMFASFDVHDTVVFGNHVERADKGDEGFVDVWPFDSRIVHNGNNRVFLLIASEEEHHGHEGQHCKSDFLHNVYFFY